jgi:oxygen-independent coproporphyrinogen-3 oxidase
MTASLSLTAALVAARLAGGDRSGRWLEDPGFGVYVHIPFCRHRCHYCDFNTYEGQDEMHGPYVDALVRDVERITGEPPEATSVFFGGGTPTLLGAPELARILGAVRSRVGIASDAEVTIEANPETVDEAKLSALLDAGFNRVSLGVQSLAPGVLQALGRTHSAHTALDAIRAARRAGFEDINADLIYGSPWERDQDWVTSVEGVLEVEPDHVAAYALTIEEATPLATLVRTGRVPDVDPDVQAARHAVAEELLGAAGFKRYEVSNWARPDRASRHNVLYWSAGDYLGLGAGAHGHTAGRRAWTVPLPRDFVSRVAQGLTTEDGYESLGPPQRAPEALMLGLRLSSGVDLTAFRRRFGTEHLAERAAVIEKLVSTGHLQLVDGHLRIAPSSTMLSNDVIARLI